ncbi:MAG: hypothetical protein IT310_09870 [Anaerolineales bacterium]|nr:hypothetical protein [Anaerolineales bacterium]
MTFLKRLHLFEISLIVVVLALHSYVALSDAYNLPNAWYTRDDAYYYFKVAQNITEGKGSSFDGINPTNGYHPLWMAICIPIFFLARYDLILPLRVLVMVMALIHVATAILIYRYLKENLSEAVGMLAAVFWLFNAYIQFTMYQYGLESPIALFFIVLLIYKLSRFEKKRRAAPVTPHDVALLAGLATLTLFSRLDLIFLALIVGVWVVFRGEVIRTFAPLDIFLIFLAFVCAVALKTDIPTYNALYARSAVQMAVIAIALKIIALYFFGAYQHPRANSIWQTIRATLMAIGAGSALTVGAYLALAQFEIIGTLPRSAFILDLLLSGFLILALRLAAYRFGSPQTKPAVSPLESLKSNWKKWLGESAIYYGIVGGALGFYMLINKLTFGASSPVSGLVKRWWGTLGHTVYDNPPANWTSFLGLGYQNAYDAWQPTSNFFNWVAGKIRALYPGSNTLDERYYIAMAFFALAALLIFWFNAQRVKTKIAQLALIPLIAACGVQILSYTATAYGGAKEWYWNGQMVLIVLIESLILYLLLKPFQKVKFIQPVFKTAAISIGVYLAARQADYFRSAMLYNYFPPDRPYMELLPFLEANTPPGAIIGMTGGGNVGYFIHDRTIVNMDGLINSYDYFQALKAGQAPAYLRQHQVQIIFASANLLEYAPYNGQFAPYLESYNVYGGKSLMYLMDEPKY